MGIKFVFVLFANKKDATTANRYKSISMKYTVMKESHLIY